MSTTLRTQRLDLVPFPPSAINRLIRGDRSGAETILGATLPEEFPNFDDIAGFLAIQLRRMEESPDRHDWMARLMMANQRLVVGHCGFHGPPDVIGRAEIGYTVFTQYRGQGFAKEAARALVEWAFTQGQQEVFASVSPGNQPSLAVVRSVGFTEVGTQEDEIDGLELVFTISSKQPG